MRHNASYPKCSRSENASKCKQRENEECSCRECKQRGSIMQLNATNPRMQHKENALKNVQMLDNAQKCMRMRYVINYTDLRNKLHHTRHVCGLTWIDGYLWVGAAAIIGLAHNQGALGKYSHTCIVALVCRVFRVKVVRSHSLGEFWNSALYINQ